MPDPQDAGGNRGRLIAFRNDRLGARLLTLVNAIRMSADLGVPFAVYWPQAIDVTAVFNDATELFDASFVEHFFISREEWMAVRPDALRIGDATRREAAYTQAETAKGRSVAVDQAFGINVFTDEDPDRIHARFVETLGQVPFAPVLRPLIARLDEALTGATAYHIRRGDLTDGLSAKNKPWPHKMVPNEFYELHVEQSLSGGGSAILFSDDAWTLEHYCRVFPALRTIRDIIDLDGLTEAQRDFIELYAMSRATRIIAPERSAFSSTAVHMGHAVKLDVTADMTPEMQRLAYDRLIARLRDRPDSFVNDGDIGQSLAHVGPYLADEGRWDEAAALFSQHVEAGLNIAFVYPETMRYQHRAGDVAGVLATGRHMHRRHVFHLRYFVEGEFLHGYGHVRADDWASGIRHIVNAFWHGPTTGGARIIIPALLDAGILTSRNFLPISQLHLDLHRRKGPVKNFIANFSEMLLKAGIKEMRALGAIETGVWDWAPLVRGVSLVAAARQGAVSEARERLALLVPGEQDVAEHASLAAILAAYDGEAAKAAETLSGLTERYPQHAMTWQRLSHAYLLEREFDVAARTADKATRLAPAQPAFAAWAGQLHLRNRNFGQAAEHFARAAAQDLGLASVPAGHAQALAGLGAHAEALAAIDCAVALAPMEAEFAIQRADILDKLGRRAEAIAVLTDMVDRHRAPGKLFRRLVTLLNASGDREGAARMIEVCRERFPKHPVTQRLVEEQAA